MEVFIPERTAVSLQCKQVAIAKTKREKDRSSDSKVTKTDNKLIRYEKTTNHDNESSWRDGESVLCEL